ncbi:group II truncated hemoglobin [Methylocapsa sp. S129]|uniref:group II truncated hemoglobin n=1 Tax=Methylocapsa sp. S129 TaxID=1641869 RepID=UPI00131BC3BD|nr:group II truncated hemoglobin [Methylocapsa sp. S129]
MTREVPTLFEWIGGAAALEKLTANFYVKVKADPLIAPIFANMDARHPHYVAQFLGEVFGGPAEYSRERGGHAHMLTKHFARHLTEAQRRRWVSLLIDAADEIGVPADPEFRSSLMAYIEWGTRIAVITSQSEPHAVEQEPMPRWGWGEVKGPYAG